MNSKNQKIISYSLAALLSATLLNSAFFFLSMLKFNALQWLTFNACSFAIIAYLLLLLMHKFYKKDLLLAIPLLPMYYYGTMGLFVMPWTADNLFPHLTHIIVTLNVLWILYIMLKEQKYESLGKGLLIGTALFVPIFVFIKIYLEAHMDVFLNAMQSL